MPGDSNVTIMFNFPARTFSNPYPLLKKTIQVIKDNIFNSLD